MKEIRNIITGYKAYAQKNKRMALASVVNIEESSYRRIGARMLVCEDGNWIGGISGGCLEGDALRQSQKAIFKDEPSRVIYDTLDGDNQEIGIGLGCNGKIEVLLTPIDKDDRFKVIQNLEKLVMHDRASILLKVIESPDEKNYLAQEIIVDNSLETLEFCEIDARTLIEEIQKTRLKRRPQIVQLYNKLGHQLRILVEYIRPETKLVIIGDNYDVLSMIRIAKELGWNIFVVGRKKKMSQAIFTLSNAVLDYEEIDTIPRDEYTAVVLMTHDYNWDKKLLPTILEMSLPYIGMLGPKKRLRKMDEELDHVDLDNLHYFHSPIGLDIGAETPEEIALSIAAEIIAVFRKRDGHFLKNRIGTIHQRI